MSKIRLSTVFFLLFGLCAGIAICIFQLYTGFLANRWVQVFMFLTQAAVLIFSCLNMIHVERQKKYNEKFAENVRRLAGSKPRMKE